MATHRFFGIFTSILGEMIQVDGHTCSLLKPPTRICLCLKTRLLRVFINFLFNKIYSSRGGGFNVFFLDFHAAD